jgi:aconitate hydratase
MVDYEAMEDRVRVVRGRLGRPLTLAEKVLLGHLVHPEGQDLRPGASLALRPDRVVLQDVLGQTAFLQLAQTGRDRVAVPTSVHCDHLVVAKAGAAADLAESRRDSDEVYAFLRSSAARYGAGFWEPGAGIIHQVVLETYAEPGALILGTDSHTPNAGGLGACAIGVGGADAVEAMAGLPWDLPLPRRIAVVLTGELGGWAAPKDVVLWVAGQLGVSGGTHAIVEYIGPGARTLSATGKATITNLGAELGATTSMFPTDDRMLRYLAATGRADLVPAIEAHRDLLAPDPEVEADPERFYDRVLRLDLGGLEPHVNGPHSPDRARPLSALAREVREQGFVDRIAATLIGSCTNSSYEDLVKAARVAQQAAAHGLRPAAPVWLTPGSERVRATLERDGVLDELGGTVLAAACGPCIGQWSRPDAGDAPNTIVTTYNRNFAGRNDGRPTTMSFLASPELAMALALGGRLSFDPRVDELVGADGAPFRLDPPGAAPDVPPGGFADRVGAYVAPPADGRGVEVRIDPRSERLAPLPRWDAWDGRDFVGCPVVIKTLGKTTTDAISPAGPWLRYRGHLERFSDNLLSGAVNAWTGRRGLARDAEGREAPVAEVARGYRAEGVGWVVVGDANYGEGSSREHAALSPRLLGCVAAIARSFARIHETNLKKQGLLALTFADPADWERVREGDRVSLLGLAELAPGRPVDAALVHADGGEERIALVHSYTEGQLGWFRRGSALAGV